MDREYAAPFRIAIRTEGPWIIGYFAHRETMKGAVELGRISTAAAEQAGGASSEAFALFRRSLVELIYPQLVTVESPWVIEPAPEHERSGHG